MYKNDITRCERVLYKDPDGNEVTTQKKTFKTFEEAVEVAKRMNKMPTQLHKVVAYKCSKCLKFHVGKTNKLLKENT